ncbi:longitudinals lacking protein, isoforms J/P/Q/S/Z isoform X1 [Eupeodes corollae]|uniref:longitudinals lacking protein, isoforms J/P/Q/S/Z isoform X1 n=1 Tax=Eupeodes corollae TaxID=290404 RepID=UPI00249028FC|nr:longitudinals lacking protein, isoforms J/P/Q/S/Z isoform X1 [Eupeodes corollae]
MDDDQQFCLRWNNHQSTLISVFDTLLENETLVDCTLAAEGKFLKAHKVVLSACSPYFATLLSEQYDKHPIFILKDVKYQELRAMMDYMYRGEVNISQDQLAALLKAAESLQIKGLSDNRTGSGNSSSGLGGVSQQQQQQKISAEQQHKHISVPGKLMTGSASAGYTLEQTKRSRIGPSSIDSQDLSGSREGSSSPTSRRRKKVRRRSIENVLADNHDNSNSSQVIQGGSSSIVPTTNATGTITAMLPMIGSGVGGTTTTISSSVASTITVAAQQQLQQQQQQASAATAAANIITANVTKKTESVKMGGNTDAMNAAVTAVDNIQDENAADSIDEKEMIMKEKQNHKRPKHQHEGVVATSTGKDEIVIEPKSEYDDEGNDETVEDLTLDDEEMGLEDLDHNAGPSHGGEGSSQGYAQWQVDRSQDEVFMAAQEAQQRDPQENAIKSVPEPIPIQKDTNTTSNQKSAQTESRIRVRNWLMLADQSILQKSILNNSTNSITTTEQETPEPEPVPEPEPAAPEPKRKRVTRLSTNTNKTNNNNKTIPNNKTVSITPPTPSTPPKITKTTSTSTRTDDGGAVGIATCNSIGVGNNIATTTTTTGTGTGDGNSTYDGVDDNTTEVIVKFERDSSSCDESETDDPFNYDLKLSSPMSWAFDSVKIEESEFEEAPENEDEDDEETADADINDQEPEQEPDTGDDETMAVSKEPPTRTNTRRVYSASNKHRSTVKKRIVDSAGLNLPPETTVTTTTPVAAVGTATTTSGNTEICMSSDKKYRILIQNQRMRKESLEHSEDMIYNANIEKPWVCKNCNRNYKWKNSLKCHLKNECGQPPRFFCSKLCGYATNVHSNLKRHLNTKCRDKIGDESDKSDNTHYTLVIKKQDA